LLPPLACGGLPRSGGEKMSTPSNQILPEAMINYAMSTSMLLVTPNTATVGFKVVEKNTFVDVVPEEYVNAANRGAQTCVGRLLEPCSPFFFGKRSGDFIASEQSTTCSDGSSSDNEDELVFPEIQFQDHPNYGETPTASPCMATSYAEWSVYPIPFENISGFPPQNCPNDPPYQNINMLPALRGYAPPIFIKNELVSLPLQPVLAVSTPEINVKDTIIASDMESTPLVELCAGPCMAQLISQLYSDSRSTVPSRPRTAQNIVVVPSIGSEKHGTVTPDGQPGCKPCAWFHFGCRNGANCKFCHLCPPKELNKRQKEKKLAFRRNQETYGK